MILGGTSWTNGLAQSNVPIGGNSYWSERDLGNSNF